MPEYQESGSVNADPDTVFAYLSDVQHLADYIPHMALARVEGERLRVAADVQGRHEEGTARFRADPDQRRIDWGGEDAKGYSGWLTVTASEPGSEVTIHLSTDRTANEADEAEIRTTLSQALANIRDQVGNS
jgi:carbon monoxide dehydrogenase subunit G